jgi:hypothetical protein
MPVKMTSDDEPGLLKCCFSGLTSQEQLNEVLFEVLRQRKETGLDRVLIDATERKESLGMIELFEIGQTLADPAFCGLRLAVYAAVLQPGLEFARTVATCKPRGADMRTFTSEQAARSWLFSPQNSRTLQTA